MKKYLHKALRVGIGAFVSLLLTPAIPLYAQEPSPQSVDNADSVMARVFSYTEKNGLRAEPFRSEVYVRHTLQTQRRNILMRYVPGFFKMEHGTNNYFGESLARYQFRPPAEVVKKDVAAYTTMPYLRVSRDRWIGRYSLSIYAPNLFTDRILSPLHRRNRRFYRYTVRSFYTAEGQRIVSIAVRPRIFNTQLVRGSFDVETSSGRVERFDFSFSYDWARLRVSGEMGRKGQASLWPSRLLLVSRLKLLGNRLDETFEGNIAYDFSPLPVVADTGRLSHRFDLTRQSLLRIDTTSMRRDRAFFDSIRPYALLPIQQTILAHDDSLRTHVADTLAIDSAKAQRRSRFFSQQTEDLLLDSHTFGMGTMVRLKLPPILTPSMVQWSKSRGFSLQTRIDFRLNMTGDRNLIFRPRVGYNFKQHQVYWRLPLNVEIRPSCGMRLNIEAAGGDHMYNASQANEVRQHLHGISVYDSLINVFDRYDFHYYRDNRLLTTFTVEPLVGLQLSVGFRFHRRALLNWNEVAARSGMSQHLTSLAPRLHLVWTPALYYYRNRRRAVALHSHWPTFMLDYERGLSTFGRSTRYERYEIDAHYTLPLYALRSLFFRAGGGFYTQRGNNCFIDYDYFRNNYLPTGRHDELSGEFQLLDSRWYNESRHYVRLCAAYESPMLLFSRLRWLTRVVEKERIYLNLLNVDRLGIYGEAGYGLSTPLLDVAAFVAAANRNGMQVGFKVALSFFDD